jgi:hypothetical protein
MGKIKNEIYYKSKVSLIHTFNRLFIIIIIIFFIIKFNENPIAFSIFIGLSVIIFLKYSIQIIEIKSNQINIIDKNWISYFSKITTYEKSEISKLEFIKGKWYIDIHAKSILPNKRKNIFRIYLKKHNSIDYEIEDTSSEIQNIIDLFEKS